jgi:hypothetical protein
MTYLYDPLRGDEISSSEAEEVVRQLGHNWPDLGVNQERDGTRKGLDHDPSPDIA